MANEAGEMGKDIQDMTPQELLSALADEGDKNRSSGKHRQAPLGDPLAWNFDLKTQELLDAYNAKFKPEENLPSDDGDHFCICNGLDDGRPMIECSNNGSCLMNWFHLECISMSIDNVPEEQEEWFCKHCVDNKLGKQRKNAHKFISESIVKKPNTDRFKYYEAVEQAATRAAAKDEEVERNKESNHKYHAIAKQKQRHSILTIRPASSDPLEVSTPFHVTPVPRNSGPDQTFVEDEGFAEMYSLCSMPPTTKFLVREVVDAATSILPNVAPYTVAINADYDNSDFEMSDVASESSGKSPRSSWTREEKTHLVECVKASNKAGLSGEALWIDVYPKMLARGVNRPLGGMRMTWLRELREQVNIDERRRKNASKMRTAIQKSKKDKEAKKADANDMPMTQKRERWQGKEMKIAKARS